MKLFLQKTRINHLIAHRNGYLMIALGSIVTNIILVIGLLFSLGYQKIILVPPVIEQPLWVNTHNVSEEYLTRMSLFFSYLLLNVTNSNAKLQHKVFLQYVEPEEYQQIKTALVLQEEEIEKEHMAISFHLTRIDVDTSNLIARIKGEVNYQIGVERLPAKELSYEFKFAYRSGLLKVMSFKEIKNNE